MESIIFPSKIKIKNNDLPNEATVTVEPCYYGYGMTLGNALRRVMLSSLPGAAATAVKIKGIQHEFSAIPHVKEDTIEVILNLKQLRLKVHSDEPVKLSLRKKGEGAVKASDIEKNSDVEVVNPDLEIATITNKNGELDMEITVSQGRGYVPVEARPKDKLEVGTIMIDSIYTPVKNIGYKVENVRVGDITNYDKLIFNIETDGSISPEEALKQSSQILIEHFNLLLDANEGNNEEATEEEVAEESEEVESDEASEAEIETEEVVAEEDDKKKKKRKNKI